MKRRIFLSFVLITIILLCIPLLSKFSVEKNSYNGIKYYSTSNENSEKKKNSNNKASAKVEQNEEVVSEETLKETTISQNENNEVVKNSEDNNQQIISEEVKQDVSVEESNKASVDTSTSEQTNNNSNVSKNENDSQLTENDKTDVEVNISPYAKFALVDDKNIKIEQNGNDIVLTGTMKEKESTNVMKSGSYVSLKITAPKKFSEKELANAKLTLLYYNNGGKVYDKGSFIENKDSNGKAYFVLVQEFIENAQYKISIDWGDQNTIVYTLTFNVDVEN